ncbi:hypothetical protein CASFOL_007748 [Castilleja foliolosa]|uniref:NADH-plastoquinone oxidoreductase subunit K n=1 Tax=Castilleja foliolosa TaxID=1961234 RepID=A0ABD3E5I8_9LAMI
MNSTEFPLLDRTAEISVISTTLNDLSNWSRLSSLWPLLYGTSCCFIEFAKIKIFEILRWKYLSILFYLKYPFKNHGFHRFYGYFLNGEVFSIHRSLSNKTSLFLVNNPRNMTGIGTTEGTKETRTTTTNSSAKIFPKSRKLSDKGFVKSSKMLMGKRIGWNSYPNAKNIHDVQ